MWGDGMAMRTAMRSVDGDDLTDGGISATSGAGTVVVLAVVEEVTGRGRWMRGRVGRRMGRALNRRAMGDRGVAGVCAAFPVVMSLCGALT